MAFVLIFSTKPFLILDLGIRIWDLFFEIKQV